MITLNKADVIAKAREAYEAKRLSAQGPTPACYYRDDSGLPCVIGACLTDEEVEKIALDYGLAVVGIGIDPDGFGVAVGSLIRERMIKTNAKQFLRDLQVAHDQWAQGQPSGERDLRKLLGIDP